MLFFSLFDLEQYKSCRSNSDCPRGYYCRVGRCYRQQYRDEADAVADPEVPFWEVNERAGCSFFDALKLYLFSITKVTRSTLANIGYQKPY